ncbi:MAG: hypothetical protein JWR69_862, partial [Pedosphaera sp.]|nr:hypothetical protein [Pedosphaera sp.]
MARNSRHSGMRADGPQGRGYTGVSS